MNPLSILKTAAIALGAVYVYNAFIAPTGKSIADFGKPKPPGQG